jgi:hypothetical protein
MQSPIPVEHTASSAELAQRLEGLQTRIASKQRDQQTLQASLPRLMIEQAGSDLAGARERRKIGELGEEIRGLEVAAAALSVAITEVEGREAESAFQAQMSAAQAAGNELGAKAKALNDAVEALWRAAIEFRDARERFDATLPPGGFTRGEITRNLPHRLALRLWVVSRGLVVPHRPPLDTWLQAHEAGYTDFERITTEYTTLALRGRDPPRPA